MTRRSGQTPIFQIAIATAPTGGSGSALARSLESELRLVKAALLYGDTVTLYSPTASMLKSTRWVSKATRADRIRFVRLIAPTLGYDLKDEELAALESFYRRPRSERRRLRVPRDLDRGFDDVWKPVIAAVDGLWAQTGGSQLADAVDSGLLELDDLAPTPDPDLDRVTEMIKAAAGGETLDVDPMVDELVRRLASLMSGTDRAYPLFDEGMSQLVSAGVREGLFQFEHSVDARNRQAAIASGMISMLPAFPSATVREILDIRQELARPLIRFRAAVVEFAREISASAFEAAFPHEFVDLYVERVAPALEEIQDAVRANNYLRRLTEEALTSPTALASGAIALGATTLADIPAVVSGAAAASAPLLRAAWTQHLNAGLLRQHRLYMLYRVNDRLSR